MPRILLHVCCGPCSLMPIVHLRDEGWEPTAFFFNPNIHPADEWKKRRDAMRIVAERMNVPLLEEGEPVNPGLWVKKLEGTVRQGERCHLCYRPRMERTAHLAREHGFDAFTSIPAISAMNALPKKPNVRPPRPVHCSSTGISVPGGGTASTCPGSSASTGRSGAAAF